MNTVLITGTNRGIGFELVNQYAKQGWLVHACYRNKNTAQQLFELADKAKNNIKLHCLDVTDNTAIQKLAHDLNSQPIDILINNAAVYGPEPQDLDNLAANEWLNTFRVNSIAPLMIAQALLTSIMLSQRKLIVNISSEMGSIANNHYGKEYLYRSSKSALNAATKSLAIDLKSKNIIVIAMDPGWVKTDMGGPHGRLTPSESVQGIRKVLDALTLADSGSFFAYDGKKVEW